MFNKVVAVAAAAGGLVLAGAGLAAADAGAHGAVIDSPGVVSSNVIQVPVRAPINACGNTVTVNGLPNSDLGDTCFN
jgi:ChpA-C